MEAVIIAHSPKEAPMFCIAKLDEDYITSYLTPDYRWSEDKSVARTFVYRNAARLLVRIYQQATDSPTTFSVEDIG